MVSEGLISVKLDLMPIHGMIKISQECTDQSQAQVGPIDRRTFSQHCIPGTELKIIVPVTTGTVCPHRPRLPRDHLYYVKGHHVVLDWFFNFTLCYCGEWWKNGLLRKWLIVSNSTKVIFSFLSLSHSYSGGCTANFGRIMALIHSRILHQVCILGSTCFSILFTKVWPMCISSMMPTP